MDDISDIRNQEKKVRHWQWQMIYNVTLEHDDATQSVPNTPDSPFLLSLAKGPHTFEDSDSLASLASLASLSLPRFPSCPN
jgi:hypothetical protein